MCRELRKASATRRDRIGIVIGFADFAVQSDSDIGTLAQQDVRRRSVGMCGVIGLAECVLNNWNWLGKNFKLQKDISDHMAWRDVRSIGAEQTCEMEAEHGCVCLPLSLRVPT